MGKLYSLLVAAALTTACATALYAFTKARGMGTQLILQAPDGHCAEPVLANDNTVTWANVTCP